MHLKLSLALAAVTLTAAVAPANASTFVFERNNVADDDQVGIFTNIKATFDTDTEIVNWSTTLKANTSTGRLAEGGWVVLSDGPNPRFDADEYVISYFDGKEGTATFYSYDGSLSAKSYESEVYLGSTSLDVSTKGDERTFAFTYDASDINDAALGPDWKGLAFDDTAGIWLHTFDGLSSSYNDDGSINTLNFTTFRNGQSYYDRGNEPAIEITDPDTSASVPEPGTIAAIGIFAAAATRLRKRLA
ncbi:MAG: PEP-CTERM sorting domain-containing protein [Cyanobacteria bacterium J06607_10]